ncbi:GAF sensor signal transduction histidine kinase [Chloroflexus aggregans DSM 9485]|uniref:histidine kinase n=2 Tax=Chloroflexus aggregans TaxID=152260 RepID=B8GAT7_CHLAD|nr:GAF sensor signal transduction histidine kinase [Chloroflexus aggregans DSM 9485]
MWSNTERLQTFLRRLLPLPALGLGWALTQLELSSLLWWGIIAYGLFNIVWLRLLIRGSRNVGKLLIGAAIGDLLTMIWFVSVAGLTPALVIVQGVGALRAWRYRFVSFWPALIPILIGVGFVPSVTAPLVAVSPEVLFSFGSILLSGLMLIAVLFLGNRRNQAAREWRTRHDQLRREQKQQVANLEASNNDLRDRLRRMEALGESLRAISSSLSLDDVLRQILDSLSYMVGVQRIDDAALSLIHGDALEHRSLYADRHTTDWADSLARAVIANRYTVSIDAHEIGQRPEWATLATHEFRSALSVPLFDPDHPNCVRGALSIVSRQEGAFSPSEERHLISFSIQAMIAIRNAELHVQLSKQRAMLSAILNDMADGLIVYDDHGKVYLDNAVARRVLQYSAEHQGVLHTRLAAFAARLFQRGESLSEEVEVKDVDGAQARYYRIQGTLVNPSPETCLAVVVLHDITDQKLREQQRRDFMAKVSHELRNPLHTLQGFLKLLINESNKVGNLNERQTEALQEVENSVNTLKKRIVDLIELNRLERGQFTINPVRTNPIDIIVTTCSQQRSKALESEVELIIDIPDQLPQVIVDEDRIRQVLTNLIENAMKATPRGGKIVVSAEQQQDQILIHVTDTGKGIASELWEKIFDPFYSRGNGMLAGENMGVGLTICRQLVEAHGGKIWVAHSEVGKGTRFSFSLPLEYERSFGSTASS